MDVVPLRGHHLLCLCAFEGKGYDSKFVENMFRIYNELKLHPEKEIILIEQADPICFKCPNFSNGRCKIYGKDHEANIVSRDRKVLEIIGLSPGVRLNNRALFKRLSQKIRKDDIPSICGNCMWIDICRFKFNPHVFLDNINE